MLTILTYVQSADGLDEYVDENGDSYYYKGDEISLYMSNNTELSTTELTQDELVTMAQEKLNEVVTYDKTDEFVTDAVFNDYELDYTLYKTNGTISLEIVKIKYDLCGNLMTINYFLDRVDENPDDARLTTEEAIEIAKDYAIDNYNPFIEVFSLEGEEAYGEFLDSDKVMVRTSVAGYICRVLFEADPGYTLGCMVCVSLIDGEISYFDELM